MYEGVKMARQNEKLKIKYYRVIKHNSCAL